MCLGLFTHCKNDDSDRLFLTGTMSSTEQLKITVGVDTAEKLHSVPTHDGSKELENEVV